VTAADTFVSTLFDVGWENAPGRTLRNSTARAWELAGKPSSGARPGEGDIIYQSPTCGTTVRYEPTTPPWDAQGQVEACSLWAGQGVDLVSREQSATEIVHEIIKEAKSVLGHLAALP
jgi:nitronate monooxygenase